MSSIIVLFSIILSFQCFGGGSIINSVHDFKLQSWASYSGGDTCTVCHTAGGIFTGKLPNDPKLNYFDDLKTPKNINKSSKFCLNCHNAQKTHSKRQSIKSGGTIIVDVNSKGKRKMYYCTNCHNIHKYDNPNLLKDSY